MKKCEICGYENMDDHLMCKQCGNSLKNSLSKINAEKIIIKQHNSIALNTTLIDCDYYKLLQGDEKIANNFTGDFMYQYSWAEPTAAWIQNKIR